MIRTLTFSVVLSCLIQVGTSSLVSAQSTSKKELKRVFSELPSPAQDAVLDYAGSLLTGETLDHQIADERSLYKNFKFLSSDSQLQLMEFARKQGEGETQAEPPLEAEAIADAAELPAMEETSSAVEPAPEITMPEEPAKPAWEVRADTLPKTTVEWKKDNYSFGTVEQGTQVSYTYEFTNTGSQPLFITRVKPACGCTVPRWSRDPVAPGEQGEIEIIFKTRGRYGPIHKTISVTLNTDPIYKVLRFKGKIVGPQPKPEPAEKP